MARPKRAPGGQPGNRNALKHGFYSQGVSQALQKALRRARDLPDTSLLEEIRLARAYTAEALRIDPANGEIIHKFLGTIARLMAINHSLNPQQERALGGALQELLAELLPHPEDA